MKSKLLIVLALVASLWFAARGTDRTVKPATASSAARAVEAEPAPSRKPARDRLAPPPKVQVAILLDTSGSMDGLIEQAKSQLWKIVNQFAQLKRDGRAPALEVALYEYGKSSLSATEGYLRMILPLTTDLDRISEELFALRTNGGDEYCGWAIRSAVNGLAWSAAAADLKVVFIAGNEPFTQGPVDYREACRAAVEKGIIVNTIHCGSMADGIQTKWQDGAFLAEGQYLQLDHNQAVVHYRAPQDEQLAKLSDALNDTYLAFGSAGVRGLTRQAEQDRNALHLAPAVAAERAHAKASTSYRNETWDLVDALKTGNVKLEGIDTNDLPQTMRVMTVEQRRSYVERKQQERIELQEKIVRLNRDRVQHLAQTAKNQALSTNQLDAVVVKTIREQAERKLYRFE